jgi:hypothetical protein
VNNVPSIRQGGNTGPAEHHDVTPGVLRPFPHAFHNPILVWESDNFGATGCPPRGDTIRPRLSFRISF